MSGRDPDAGDPETPTNDADDADMLVAEIRDGTVIDHVRAGQALNVLRVLGIDGSAGDRVSVGMNVHSDRLGRKDVLKVEDRELSQAEVDVVSLIAPEATINIIRDHEVRRKDRVDRPAEVVGVLACPNPRCITAADEPTDSRFAVLEDGVRCDYCETIVREGIADLIDGA